MCHLVSCLCTSYLLPWCVISNFVLCHFERSEKSCLCTSYLLPRCVISNFVLCHFRTIHLCHFERSEKSCLFFFRRKIPQSRRSFGMTMGGVESSFGMMGGRIFLWYDNGRWDLPSELQRGAITAYWPLLWLLGSTGNRLLITDNHHLFTDHWLLFTDHRPELLSPGVPLLRP